MTIHVEFKEHRRVKYGPIDYTFLDRHTSEEIAFGSYNGSEGFEVISLRDGSIERYANAAVAWTKLNHRLQKEYGY